MASYIPAKKNTAYITYIALVDRSTGQFKSNPTLATGDVKVSIDGGALANLATLPVVTPASSIWVKISLSTSEMNGDNINVQFLDAAGAEWNDAALNIPTVARQIDDLTFPNTSGRGMDVDASGGVEVGSVQANSFTASALDSTAVDEIADGVWDEGLVSAHESTQTAGRYLLVAGAQSQFGTAQAGAAGTITLQASAVATDDYYNGQLIFLRSGTGLNQARVISDYVGATKVATVATNWVTNPDNTTLYAIMPAAGSADAATIADAVWDEAQAGHVTAGTTGLNLSNSTLAAWLAGVIEGSHTLGDFMRLMASVLTGKSSGGGTTTVVFRDVGDTKNRISATVDANGNRTAVGTRDGT